MDETITRASTTESYNQLRALMAQFMFKGDAIYKKVRGRVWGWLVGWLVSWLVVYEYGRLAGQGVLTLP